jgi:hypothetical protein
MDWNRDSRARLFLSCSGVLLLVAAVGFIFDYLLVKEGFRRVDILLESNVLTGIVAAVFFYYLSNYQRERRRMVQQQLRTIAEMNHHIRNALQIITYAASTQRHEDSVELVRTSVERIEWSLREVLPTYAPTGPEAPKLPVETAHASNRSPEGRAISN